MPASRSFWARRGSDLAQCWLQAGAQCVAELALRSKRRFWQDRVCNVCVCKCVSVCVYVRGCMKIWLCVLGGIFGFVQGGVYESG